MATSSVQLWERIQAAGLATSEECRRWAIEIAKSSSAEGIYDPGNLAAELIRQGKITPFQANVLFGKLDIPLVIGPYRVSDSLESQFGANWYKATDATNPDAPAHRCYILTAKQLSKPSHRNWPLSLELARKHLAVIHPSLDRWVYAGIEKSSVVAVCEKVETQTLSKVLDTKPLSWQEAVSLIEQIAAGLQKLHDSGLVHGCVCPDSIECADDGEFVLRRDPLFPPSTPYSSIGNSILHHKKETWISAAAPELTLPNAFPTIQTDLYALGCTWYQALTQNFTQTVSSNGTPDLWAAEHLNGPRKSLSENVLPSSLQRCLSHLLAKNPASRFATATALMRAIEFAANEAVAEPKSRRSNRDSSLSRSANISNTTTTHTAKQERKIAEPAPIDESPETIVEIAKSGLKSNATDTRTPKPEHPKPEHPKPELPKPELPKPELPKPELPKPELPKPELPKPELPKPELPKPELPKPELPKPEHPKPELPKPETRNPKPVDLPTKVANSPTKNGGKVRPSAGGKNKKKGKKKKKPVWVLPAMIVGACLLFGAVIFVLVQNGSTNTPIVQAQNTVNGAVGTSLPNSAAVTSNQNQQPTIEPDSNTPTLKPMESVAEYYSVASDDGQALWAPPFAGSAYSLELFPAGVETVVFVSGNVWQRRGVASALGKWWSESQPELAKQFAAIPFLSDARIQSVAIGLYPSKNPGLPQATFRITFAQPVSIGSILQADPSFKVQLFDSKLSTKKGFWSNGRQYDATSIVMDELQTETTALVKRAVVGPSDLLASLPELDGAPAPLRRQLETLLKTTDSRSDLTVLSAPSFLFGDGRELLSAHPKLQEAIRATVDESMQAILFATAIEPRWYMELRMLSSETRDVGKFASALKSSLVGLPDAFESSLSSGVALHPYWRALGLRYPQMMRAMNRYLRIGLEDGQVVANVYLPTDAMNNIAIASWMALNHSASGAEPSMVGKPPPTTKPSVKPIDEVLQTPVTVGFEQESLEAALQLIATEVAESLKGSGLSMNIDGPSFQKEGITRNQSIRDFKQSGVPLRTVLTDLVRRANPVTTVKSATERNQKVVWVVMEDPERPGSNKIELTTRSNAEAKKFTLPKEFVAE